MRHFSSEEWADFVRNLSGQEESVMMQSHLDRGCATCSNAFAAWARFRDVATRETEDQPPESAVRTVKGLLAIHGGRRRAHVAALLFDSFVTPAPVGVRSATGPARQMLYEVDNYRIDLRLEAKTGSNAISVMGQILSSGEPAPPLERTTVALLSGRRILSTSQSNEFGEFHLECEAPGSLRLQFLLPEGRVIRTPIIECSEATKTNTAGSNGIEVHPFRGNTRAGTQV